MKKLLIYFTLIACVGISCKKEPALPDCGCNSMTIREIKDVPANFAGRTFLVNKDPNSSTYIASICDTTLLKGLPASPPLKTDDYFITGKLKPPCIPDGVHPIVILYNIELTSIRKNQ